LLVTRRSLVSVLLAVGLFIVFLVLWFVLPNRHRRSLGAPERGRSAGDA
jgi:hypothetical protein